MAAHRHRAAALWWLHSTGGRRPAARRGSGRSLSGCGTCGTCSEGGWAGTADWRVAAKTGTAALSGVVCAAEGGTAYHAAWRLVL